MDTKSDTSESTHVLKGLLTELRTFSELLLHSLTQPAVLVEILIARGWLLDNIPPDYLKNPTTLGKDALEEAKETGQNILALLDELAKELEEKDLAGVIRVVERLIEIFEMLEAVARIVVGVLLFPYSNSDAFRFICLALADDLIQHFGLIYLFRYRPLLTQLLIFPPCRALYLACAPQVWSTGQTKVTGAVLLRASIQRPVIDLSSLRDWLQKLSRNEWNPWRTFWSDLGSVSEANAPKLAEDYFTPPRELLMLLGAQTWVYADLPVKSQNGVYGNETFLNRLALSVGYCPELLDLEIADTDRGNYTWEGTTVQLVPGYKGSAIDGGNAPAVELHLHKLMSWSRNLSGRTFDLKVNRDSTALVLREHNLNLAADLAFEATLTSGGPGMHLGNPCGTHAWTSRSNVEVACNTANGHFQARLDLGTCGLLLGKELAIGPLRSVFPDGIKLSADLALRWSIEDGLHLECQNGHVSGGSLQVPQRVVLGPLTIEHLRLGARLLKDPFGVEVYAAADAKLTLGVATLTIGGVGVAVALDVPEQGGNLGLARLRIKPKTPDSVTLAIDGGAVKGSGTLSIDRDRHLYQGQLTLQLGTLNLMAIGILATELPNGKPGHSLLALINVTFPTPLQLGYGFTLNAVGGLLGMHRASNPDALRAGLQSGAVGNILFPKDPVANVSQLLSDLDRFFPIRQDRHLFGPMLQLGWGTPTLITASLALLLELPKPVRLTALGSLRAVMPCPEAPLVNLQVDVLGILDFDRKELSLDGSLVKGSMLFPYALTGQMALRSSWGKSPGFALSFGGFHPAFTPPPGFPTLERVGFSLTASDLLKIRFSSYLALTTSSAQLGARVDLRAGTEVLGQSVTAEGTAGFDALFEFNPFRFQTSIDASIAVCLNSDPLLSAKVHGALSGPTPWKLQATASIEACGCEVEVSFSKTVQGGKSASIVARNPQEELQEALKEPSSWSTLNPGGQRDSVLWVMPAASDGLVAHPRARLGVKQHLLPLDTTLQCFGNAPLEGSSSYSITRVCVGAQDFKCSTLKDTFPRALYTRLSETERLSGAAFEEKPAGLQFEKNALVGGDAVTATFEYTTVLIDERNATQGTNHRPGLAFLLALARRSAKARQSGSSGQVDRFSNPSGMSNSTQEAAR